MPIDYHTLKSWPIPEIEQTYTKRDTILYALGLNFGADPTDERQLRFVYERDLRALPTMAVVLGYPGFWMQDPGTGIDWKMIVHGEEALRLHKPLPSSGTVLSRHRVSRVIDKGAGRGAIVIIDKELFDRATGDKLATVTHTAFCRADGGFGQGDEPMPGPAPVPDSPPHATCDLATLPQQALIYRLSADLNPLHADPAIARAAGFDRPILHGLSTFGVAGHALIKTYCDYEPARLMSLFARFSAPVYPGETIRTEMWRESRAVHFRARSLERDVVVLDRGRAEVD